MKLFLSKLFFVLWYVVGQSTANDAACPLDDSHETTVMMFLESEEEVGGEGLTQAAIDAIADGFMNVYNDMQAGFCDDETKIIETVEVSLFEERRLSDADDEESIVEERQLQYIGSNTTFLSSYFSFFFRIVFACRGCPGGAPLFDDAARRLGQAQMSKAASRGKPDKFMKKFDKWIEKEHSSGRLQSIIVKENKGQLKHVKFGN
mmetsp:Transcript_31850/g.52503  ORF Transcript_31850/g.52503 Transcript_31850/m.52503 type:complete len:205 (-) Transcript_31850:110-724(-)|eukprot:CAMPEP_0119014176 /NCGR_PEP_ID=MMETSP1176-20130426/9398_1 /TAXON_ID=265551 /ORGANISM="Synedropsis recta cf, Strain CCMP1620" /LENGTH=204 /DNA_ID=CAMNT_0006967325 /DNA_START=23 /DNA_END=637 /DNA_ORIENTATION=-